MTAELPRRWGVVVIWGYGKNKNSGIERGQLYSTRVQAERRLARCVAERVKDNSSWLPGAKFVVVECVPGEWDELS